MSKSSANRIAATRASRRIKLDRVWFLWEGIVSATAVVPTPIAPCKGLLQDKDESLRLASRPGYMRYDSGQEKPTPETVMCSAGPHSETSKYGLPRGETLLEEAAVAITVNGISQAVMLATPQDLEHFALGFCLSEGLLTEASALRDIEVSEQAEGWQVELTVSAQAAQGLRQRLRHMAGPSGCGLCGVDSLTEAMRLPPPRPPAPLPDYDLITGARRQLPRHQTLRQQAGGLHGAAFFDATGSLIALAEDVGRHNALDKLYGALLSRNIEPSAGFVVITSRCSHDLVAKAARCGISSLISLSLPTTLAVQSASHTGVNLLCFQGEELKVYYQS